MEQYEYKMKQYLLSRQEDAKKNGNAEEARILDEIFTVFYQLMHSKYNTRNAWTYTDPRLDEYRNG